VATAADEEEEEEEETAELKLDVVDCMDWLFELGTTKLYMLNLFGPPLERNFSKDCSILGYDLAYQISVVFPLHVYSMN